VQLQFIQEKIFTIRGERVMLDFDLAELFEVETKVLKQAVKRNIERFPSDFMFEITIEEYHSLRSQIVTSTRGGRRYMPYAFTEQGVSMLSSVLKSQKAIEVNIAIIRAFVLLRQHLMNYSDLKKQLLNLESEMNLKFKDINQVLNYLMDKDVQIKEQLNRKRIGFKTMD
jgi:hypothetical protein